LFGLQYQESYFIYCCFGASDVHNKTVKYICMCRKTKYTSGM
jgi:hypothetical protein